MKFPRPVLHAVRIADAVLFWPMLALVVWGELASDAPLAVIALIARVPDKILHFIAYFWLAGMAGLASKRRRPVVVAVVGLILLGGCLEIIQGFVGRDMSIYDELANTAGALTGAALARFIVEPLRRRFADA
jgi:VanZ family protein